MKTALFILALLSASASAQEAMTAERFKAVAAAPGDATALRKELTALPLWRKVKSSIAIKYQDGKTFHEESFASTKTVEGKYIVSSLESKFYKQTMHVITGYDEKAKAMRDWSLIGETLIEGTVVVDPVKRISASTAAYGDGFTEISVNSYTDREATFHAQVFKNGVLFMTREGKAEPITDSEKGDGVPATPSPSNSTKDR